jgi:hypothetical protein
MMSIILEILFKNSSMRNEKHVHIFKIKFQKYQQILGKSYLLCTDSKTVRTTLMHNYNKKLWKYL